MASWWFCCNWKVVKCALYVCITIGMSDIKFVGVT